MKWWKKLWQASREPEVRNKMFAVLSREIHEKSEAMAIVLRLLANPLIWLRRCDFCGRRGLRPIWVRISHWRDEGVECTGCGNIAYRDLHLYTAGV